MKRLLCPPRKSNSLLNRCTNRRKRMTCLEMGMWTDEQLRSRGWTDEQISSKVYPHDYLLRTWILYMNIYVL